MNSMNLYWLAFLQRCAYPSLFVCVCTNEARAFPFGFYLKKKCVEKNNSVDEMKSAIHLCEGAKKCIMVFFRRQLSRERFKLLLLMQVAMWIVFCVLCVTRHDHFLFNLSFSMMFLSPFHHGIFLNAQQQPTNQPARQMFALLSMRGGACTTQSHEFWKFANSAVFYPLS